MQPSPPLLLLIPSPQPPLALFALYLLTTSTNHFHFPYNTNSDCINQASILYFILWQFLFIPNCSLVSSSCPYSSWSSWVGSPIPMASNVNVRLCRNVQLMQPPWLMAGEEYSSRRSALAEDYREVVNNRRGGVNREEDYREVAREKMRFLRTLTVRIDILEKFFQITERRINPWKS